MTTYRFTATLTKRPFIRTYKGSVKMMGNALDAFGVVRQIILEKDDGILDDGTSVKITISPSRKKG
jgi:hypothetical protein